MAELFFENVDKVYDNGFQAVFNFNLEVKDKEFIVFVGPSGCGKSTMLRTIAGLEEITHGRLFIDGECVNNKSARDRGIAMIFQSYALYPHMNVYENMAFALTLEGNDEDYIEKRVKETAAILGLSDYLDRKPRELSGGQCQRVAVGRAIIRKPKVFLMDEPLSNLDAKQRANMRSEIIEIHRKTNATTIYVTHDQIEAMTMADRIVVMKDGYIQQVGTPYELYFNPFNKFVAGFIGEPPMNFLPCIINDGIATIIDTNLTIDLSKIYPKSAIKYNGQNMTVGFRPESIVICKKNSTVQKDTVLLRAKIELTELLGDNANAYVNIGEHKAILRLSSYDVPKVKSICQFMIPYKSIYLFEEASSNVVNED